MSDHPSSRPPPVPDHELIRCIGRGSYGEVWLAKSVTGALRAVKIVERKTFERDRPFDREFAGIQKFEPISRTHPGLVSILHVGRNLEAGYFYYVMELADDVAGCGGRGAAPTCNPETYAPLTLRSRLQPRAPLPVVQIVTIVQGLADALAHLHRQGLVHRDIKPANIIFVNGAPKFADIGLVTGIGERSTAVGTAGYLAPEGPGGAAADLYSLGMVLYELCLGQEPEQFPELPEALRGWSDAPERMRLLEICLTACHHDARQRFPSADAMRAALAVVSPAQTATGTGEVPAGARASVTRQNVCVLGDAADPSARRVAELFVQRLAGPALTIKVDVESELSVTWARALERNMAGWDVVVLLVSATSCRSERLAYTVEIAQQTARRRGGRPRLLALLLGAAAPWPRALRLALADAPALTWNGPDDDGLVAELRDALQSVPDAPQSKAGR